MSTMFLKVNQGSILFGPLFDVFHSEAEREKKFNLWMKDNLPEFKDILTKGSTYTLYGIVVGWQFVGEVDRKVWQPFKGYNGFYEPNRRTKLGKAMMEKINDAMGQPFNRLSFFDMFHTKIPGNPFTVPNGFLYENFVYMKFDDRNYNDIKENCCGQYDEITYSEFEEKYNQYIDSLGEE